MAGVTEPEPLHTSETPRWLPAALAAIVAVALLARLGGIWFGLPFIYTADGESRFVEPAVGFLTTGDLNPHWFGHPGSPVMYLFGLNYAVVYLFGRLGGTFTGVADLGRLLEDDPTIFYLIARVWAALFGAAAVALVYAIGRRIWDWRVGLVAAVILAFSPLHHEWSQIGRTDAPATFLILVAVALCLRLLDRPTAVTALGAGLAIGLAGATKFNTAVLALALGLAVLLSDQRRWRLLLAGVAGAGLGFFLGAPFVILDWRTALPQMLFENRGSHPGADRLPGILNLWWYVGDAIPRGLGWLAALLALIGLVWQAARVVQEMIATRLRKLSLRCRQVIVLLAFPAAYFALIGIASLRWAHWVVPLMPFGALLAATALVGLADRLALAPRARGWAIAGATAAVIALPAFGILRSDVQLSHKNTQTLAQEWFAATVPAGTVVGSEWYTGLYWSKTIRLIEEPSLALKPVEYFRDAGAEYLVASSDVYDRFFKEPERYAETVAAYERIFSTLPLIQEFRPDPWRRPGPAIQVFRLADSQPPEQETPP